MSATTADLNEEVTTKRELGKQYFRQQDWGKAIDAWTEAIELDTDNATGELGVLYSNRSVAHLKRKNYTDALADGNLCVQSAPDWPKGFGRVGDAAFHLKQYEKAIAAYEKGLTFEPTNAKFKQEIARCRAAASGGSARSASSGGAPRAYVPQVSASALAKSARGSGAMYMCVAALQGLVLITSLLSLLPLGSLSTVAYVWFCRTAMLSQLLSVVVAHGVPQFNRAYLQRCMLDEQSHFFVHASLMSMCSPFALGVLPLAARALVFTAVATSHNVQRVLPALKPFVAPGCALVESKATTLASATARIEVAIGFLFIVRIFTPQRQLLLVLFQWQFLQIRWLVSPQIKAVFAGMRQMGDQYCPGFAVFVWHKLRDGLIMISDPQRAAEAQQQAAAGGGLSGLASKCTVM
jgi:hypothetical protein